MEIFFKLPSILSKYHRRHAVRLRGLAQDATMDAIREHLLEVALQYDKLAEGAAMGDHHREVARLEAGTATSAPISPRTRLNI